MTAPNEFMRAYYDTMPAILPAEQALEWLRGGFTEIPPTTVPLELGKLMSTPLPAAANRRPLNQ